MMQDTYITQQKLSMTNINYFDKTKIEPILKADLWQKRQSGTLFSVIVTRLLPTIPNQHKVDYVKTPKN